MKIMLMRECQGVYQFGQRRVNIKVEQGNKIYVQVGSGYLTAKEFIDQFTESEVQRVERINNVIQNFNNKANV